MTALPALAALADVQARSDHTLTTQENARATTLLGTASNRIRSWCRQDFTQNQSVMISPPIDNQIILPQQPVISVDAVARMNPDGITYIGFAVWTFDGIDRIMLASPSTIANAPEWWTDADWYWRNITFRVQYTHGYAVIPDDVVDTCAWMVARVIDKPGAAGAASEMIGGYSYRYPSDYPAGVVAFTDEDRETLRKYRGNKNRSIELR